MGAEQYADSSSFETFFSAVGNFLVMFCGSAAIGIIFALISALISLKILCYSFYVIRYYAHSDWSKAYCSLYW